MQDAGQQVYGLFRGSEGDLRFLQRRVQSHERFVVHFAIFQRREVRIHARRGVLRRVLRALRLLARRFRLLRGALRLLPPRQKRVFRLLCRARLRHKPIQRARVERHTGNHAKEQNCAENQTCGARAAQSFHKAVSPSIAAQAAPRFPSDDYPL